MFIPFKRITAVLLILSLSLAYFMACGVAEDNVDTTEDASKEESVAISYADSTEESDKTSEESDSKEQSVVSKEESSMAGGEETREEDSQITVPDSSEAPDKNDDSSVTSPDDSSVAPPDDSSATPPDDSSVTPPDDSSVAPPDDSTVAPPDDSTVAPPDDSSEEPIVVPKDPSDPIMPIPTEFGYNPVDTYFDNSVFIGYSIMMHFGRYVDNWRQTVDSRIMGTAEFRAGVGMNFRANKNQDPTEPDTTLPKHNNVAYHFEDLPSAMGVKTMVIGLMPYSDMRLGGPDTCVERGSKCEIEGLKKIKEKNPDLHIICLAGTYNTGIQREGSINLDLMHNQNVREFNNKILEYCNEAGIDFVDVATPLTNGYGYFIEEWASDRVYHIRQEPYKIWIKVLRDYATKKQAGTWQNPTVMPELGM